MEQISSIKNIYKHKISKMSEAESFVGHSPLPNYNLFDGDSVEDIDKTIFQNNLLPQTCISLYKDYLNVIIMYKHLNIYNFPNSLLPLYLFNKLLVFLETK